MSPIATDWDPYAGISAVNRTFEEKIYAKKFLVCRMGVHLKYLRSLFRKEAGHVERHQFNGPPPILGDDSDPADFRSAQAPN